MLRTQLATRREPSQRLAMPLSFLFLVVFLLRALLPFHLPAPGELAGLSAPHPQESVLI